MLDMPKNWQRKLLDIAHGAGQEILKVYMDDFEVETKSDGSPLTLADKRAHHYIVKALTQLTTQIPIVSEESYKVGVGTCQSSTYWLVDPLDGTKEFIKRNGEFTVNIALMHRARPVWGVVFAPVKKLTYYGGTDSGSKKINPDGQTKPLNVRIQQNSHCGMVVSRSHLSNKIKAMFKMLETKGYHLDIVASGSSLKFCMIADGQADCYPRLGLTSEWDTAAAEAVLVGAGGGVVRFNDGQALSYNKDNILNPEFMACSKLDETFRQQILDWYNQDHLNGS